MSRIAWDQVGERTYETGVDHGVLYLQEDGQYPKAVPWSGLISVSENPSGAEDNALYADNIKYLNIKSAEEFGLSVECYTTPDEWAECDGTAELIKGVRLGQQKRRTFGFSFRSKKGNDTQGEEYGYLIHLAYGCSAAPSERGYQTINESPDAITFSYDISTTPVPFDGYRATACVVIDSTKIDPEILAKLEDTLYGTEEAEGHLPLPDELIKILGISG